MITARTAERLRCQHPGQTRQSEQTVFVMGLEKRELSTSKNCVQFVHHFRMTDNGVEMVGGESNNQGQVSDKLIFVRLSHFCISEVILKSLFVSKEGKGFTFNICTLTLLILCWIQRK